MKVLMLVCLLLVSSYVGYVLSRRYRRRARFMKDLQRFCEESSSNVSFNHAKVQELIDSILMDCGEEFTKLMCIYRDYLTSGCNRDLLQDNIRSTLNYLKTNEIQNITNFLVNIGTSDTEGELNNFNNYNTVFKTYRDTTDQESKKMAPMCIKLGVLLGVALVVIFL